MNIKFPKRKIWAMNNSIGDTIELEMDETGNLILKPIKMGGNID